MTADRNNSNELALPVGVTQREVKLHAGQFARATKRAGDVSFLNLYLDLRNCIDDEQRKSIFALALNALDVELTRGEITFEAFHGRINELVGLDDSPYENGMARGYELIKDVIVKLAEMDSEVVPDGEELALFDEGLEVDQEKMTPYGLAIRLCRNISTEAMVKNLDMLDLKLGLVTPRRVAEYLGRYIWDVFNYYKEVHNKNGNSSYLYVEGVEKARDILNRIIEIEDEGENGFVGEVLAELKKRGNFSDRSEIDVSFFQNAIQLMADNGCDSAEQLLSSGWLDRYRIHHLDDGED